MNNPTQLISQLVKSASSDSSTMTQHITDTQHVVSGKYKTQTMVGFVVATVVGVPLLLYGIRYGLKKWNEYDERRRREDNRRQRSDEVQAGTELDNVAGNTQNESGRGVGPWQGSYVHRVRRMLLLLNVEALADAVDPIGADWMTATRLPG